jgi:dTDP-4-dehydrorhamnose reductase
MKALLVGAEGGLGRAFGARLGKLGESVALGHSQLDVSRRNDVVRCVRDIRPDAIFDMAGFADVDACEVDRWQAYLVNRDGAKHLAQAAAEVGALLVYPSSDLVFDGARPTPYREEDSPNPLSIYGDTKLAAELAVMSHAPRHLVLRTGWMFGPHGRSFVNEFLDWRATENVVFAHDDHRGQLTPQSEFVEAVLELVRREQTGLWHVASSGDATQFEVAREVYKILGAARIEVRPTRRGPGARTALRPRYSALDCSKLSALGLHLRPWQESLREFLLSAPH